MSFYENRIPGRIRPSSEQRLVFANDAARLGVRATADKHNVSHWVVRQSCIMNGVKPCGMKSVAPKEERVKSALHFLKTLGLKPEDLIHNNESADTGQV